MNIEMFSKENCPQCVLASHWLTQQGFTFKTLKLERDFEREDLLSQFPAARTYPQFKLNGQPVGDLKALQATLTFEEVCAF